MEHHSRLSPSSHIPPPFLVHRVSLSALMAESAHLCASSYVEYQPFPLRQWIISTIDAGCSFGTTIKLYIASKPATLPLSRAVNQDDDQGGVQRAFLPSEPIKKTNKATSMRHTAKLTLGADSKQPYSLLPLLTLMMTFSSGSIMRLWRLSFSLLFFRFPFSRPLHTSTRT